MISLNPNVGVAETEHRPLQSPILQISASPIPARSRVNIYYSLPKSTAVRLSIYDVSGRLIRNLVDGTQEAGLRVVLWQSRDDTGAKVSDGIYFCHLTARDVTGTKKLIVLR